MGWGRACLCELEEAMGRTGVLGTPDKAPSSAIVTAAVGAAGASAVSIPCTCLSNAKRISPTKWVAIRCILLCPRARW